MQEVGPTRSARWELAALAALGALAFVVRVRRLPVSWNYWALDYVSYAYRHRELLRDGKPAWTEPMGLHPGAWAQGVALWMAGGGSVRGLYALSLACSLGALVLGAWTLRRWGRTPALAFALLFALSPYQAHYGLELNNYPLLLLGTSLLVAGLLRPGRCLVFPGALLALNAHLFGWVLAGAALLARRDRRTAGSVGLAALLAAPAWLGLLSRRGGTDAFHNERPAELAATLWAAAERFSPGWSLLLYGAAVGLGGSRALRSPQRRGAALTLLALGGSAAAVTVVFGWLGVAFLAQTPYWLPTSLCLLLVAALGLAGPGRGRIALALLLAASWAPGAARALHPRPQHGVLGRLVPGIEQPPGPLPAWTFGAAGPPGPRVATDEEDAPEAWWARRPRPGLDGPRVVAGLVPDVAGIRAEVLRRHGEGDVLVLLSDTAFDNDQPRFSDPLFGLVRPHEVGDWTSMGAESSPFTFAFGGGALHVRAHSCLRGGAHEAALTRVVRAWLAEGRTVRLIWTRLDPLVVPPDPRDLRAAVSDAATWQQEELEGLPLLTISPR